MPEPNAKFSKFLATTLYADPAICRLPTVVISSDFGDFEITTLPCELSLLLRSVDMRKTLKKYFLWVFHVDTSE